MTAATTAPTSAVSPSYPPAVRLRRPLPGWVRECTPDAAGNRRAGWRLVWAVCIPRPDGEATRSTFCWITQHKVERVRSLDSSGYVLARTGIGSGAGRRPGGDRLRRGRGRRGLQNLPDALPQRELGRSSLMEKQYLPSCATATSVGRFCCLPARSASTRIERERVVRGPPPRYPRLCTGPTLPTPPPSPKTPADTHGGRSLRRPDRAQVDARGPACPRPRPSCLTSTRPAREPPRPPASSRAVCATPAA
jgi:hypothetical protein